MIDFLLWREREREIDDTAKKQLINKKQQKQKSIKRNHILKISFFLQQQQLKLQP